MRRSFLAVAVGALLLVTTPMRAEELVYARFADYVEALRVQIGIPGLAAAIVGRTGVLWEGGFGYQDVSRAIVMRPDTPMHLDGVTQVVTATELLRCTEENRLSLDAPVSLYTRNAPEPEATLRQLLSQVSGSGDAVSFSYRPDRLDAAAAAVKSCAGNSYRETTANLLERLAMVNSVPGADILALVPPAEGIPSGDERATYASALARLATPYAVDGSKRAYPAQFAASTLTPSTGLIASVHDFAQFDLALRGGVLLRPDTLADAWRVGIDGAGKPLPHGLGWFVQTYGTSPVVWQFGSGGESGSSSLVIVLPTRDLSLIMMANSTGLTKSFALDKGDVATSPFARIFLSLFAR
jgi:CubicO group peptidase (beta-lactamase class C family)